MKMPVKIKQLEKLIGNNSPVILTAFGVTGVVATAYLTGKATLKAQRIWDAQTPADWEPYEKDLSFKTKFDLSWKLYIAPVVTGVLTCGAIVMANRIGTRRTAAMAGALAITERAYDEYKTKVVETIGKNKENKIRTEVQQERINRGEQPTVENILVTGKGEVLCKDAWSGRYFKSSMEEIKAAQNHVNHQINVHGNASLSEFYNWLGLENTKESDNVGWDGDLLEVMFTSAISDKQEPVLVMDFLVQPIPNFWKTHR